MTLKNSLVDAPDEALMRSYRSRTERLARLFELNAPKSIISNEIDLVLMTIEEIERRKGDSAMAARLRHLTDIQLQREIEEAGGQEAWERKVDEELAREEAEDEAADAVKH